MSLIGDIALAGLINRGHKMNMNLFYYLLTEFLNRNKSKSSRMMLLDTSELPGEGWKIVGKRSWRTGGHLKKTNERSLRAYQAGTFTAWRDYEQVSPSKRNLWIAVMPYASEEDAETEVPCLRSHLVRNVNTTSKIIEERQIDDQQISGVSNVFIFEQSTQSRKGPGIARYASGNVGQVVFLLACFGQGENWPWTDVMNFAAKQANKIRDTLAEQLNDVGQLDSEM